MTHHPPSGMFSVSDPRLDPLLSEMDTVSTFVPLVPGAIETPRRAAFKGIGPPAWGAAEASEPAELSPGPCIARPDGGEPPVMEAEPSERLRTTGVPNPVKYVRPPSVVAVTVPVPVS